MGEMDLVQGQLVGCGDLVIERVCVLETVFVRDANRDGGTVLRGEGDRVRVSDTVGEIDLVLGLEVACGEVVVDTDRVLETVFVDDAKKEGGTVRWTVIDCVNDGVKDTDRVVDHEFIRVRVA